MSSVCTLGFTGKHLDFLTACYPLGNGYRFYLPALFRFNAPDDFSPFGPGKVNPYLYCSADPVNRADPSGHISVSVPLADREMAQTLNEWLNDDHALARVLSEAGSDPDTGEFIADANSATKGISRKRKTADVSGPGGSKRIRFSSDTMEQHKPLTRTQKPREFDIEQGPAEGEEWTIDDYLGHAENYTNRAWDVISGRNVDRAYLEVAHKINAEGINKNRQFTSEQKKSWYDSAFKQDMTAAALLRTAEAQTQTASQMLLRNPDASLNQRLLTLQEDLADMKARAGKGVFRNMPAGHQWY
jgi:RHS repeat-associated protein